MIDRARHAFGPIDYVLGRVAGGAAVLAIAWWLSGRPYRVTRGDLWRIFVASLCGTVLPFVILGYCIGPDRFGHSYFGMMVAFVPLATIAISVPMLGIWPTRRQVIGVLGGLACIIVLAQEGIQRGMSPGLIALALAVPLGYASGNTFVKWQLTHIPAVPLTMLQLAAAAMMLLPLELFPTWLEGLNLGRPPDPSGWSGAIASLAFLGIIGTGIAVWLFNRLIIGQGPLFAGMVTYVLPVLALAWGAIDGEKVSARQMAAMAGVLAMVALVQWGTARAPRAVGELSGGEPVPAPQRPSAEQPSTVGRQSESS